MRLSGAGDYTIVQLPEVSVPGVLGRAYLQSDYQPQVSGGRERTAKHVAADPVHSVECGFTADGSASAGKIRAACFYFK